MGQVKSLAAKILPLLCAAFMLFVLSCDSIQLSDEAQKFRQNTTDMLTDLAKQVKPYMDENQRKKIGDIFEKTFVQARQKGQDMQLGLIAFDAKSSVLAGRYPEGNSPKNLAALELSYNYGNYKGVAKVIEDGKTNHLVLYKMDQKIYLVCKPVKDGSDVLGAVCMGWSPAISGHKMPCTEEEFKAMEFD